MPRLTILIALSVSLVLAACSATSYDLPAVSTATDGKRHSGKFIWHDLISDDPKGTEAFYGALFGWQFRSLDLLGANYWVISLEGTPIAGMVDQSDIAATHDISQWISVMSVPDPSVAAAIVSEAGGQVLRQPVSLGERGTIAVFADAQGAHFATLTTTLGDPVDRDELPGEGAFLWHELWTANVPEAVLLYSRLGSLASEARGGAALSDEIDYRVLRNAEEPRAGIRELPDPGMPTLWMPYLRVATLDRLKALLGQVPGLGGEVLVPAMSRPAGGYVAVIAGPSGAPVALQTWGNEQPLLKDL